MTQAIKSFLHKNRTEIRRDVALVGDGMVDEYHKVSVNRISPEFPMPIMLTDEQVHGTTVSKPGGIANVAFQMQNFNVSAELFCFSDALLDSVLAQHSLFGNSTRSLQGYNAYVPRKHRFIDGHVQVVRWDEEMKNYGLSNDKLAEFQDKMKQLLLRDSNCYRHAVLSDYNKGFFAGDDNWIQYLPDSYTIVDPKAGPLSKWRGCEVFKPNYKEACDLTGVTCWKTQARILKKELGCEAVLITCGGDGVKGFWGDQEIDFCPDSKVKVLSVVGAGDCFCAGLVMAVSHNFTGLEAVEIAYGMGAQYVQHDLNRPIYPVELSKDKLVDPEDLANRDFKLSFTNGCFDILHEGHLQTLRFAKSKGDKLVVALNSDESIRRLKGEGRPIKKLEQRANIMAAFEFVDFVVSFDEDTPAEVLAKIKPDVLVKGSQYELEKIVGADTVKEVYRAPMVDGVSTTALIGR